MAAKQLLFERTARGQIAEGLDALADAVKVTLGPCGRNVVIENAHGAPTITKDGVTVAKEIELDRHAPNMGAQMVKEVASKTSEIAGDGTTSATVLAQAIYREGDKLVAAGIDPMDIKRGIEEAVKAAVVALGRMSKPTGSNAEIAQVATISANGDADIGELIARAMKKTGTDGVITVDEGNSMDTTLEVVAGMQIDRGYLSPYFVTDAQRMETVLDDAFILIHEKKLSNMQEMMPLLELVAQEGKALLVVAEDVDGDALSTLVVNRLRGSLKVCAIKAPGFGDRRSEILRDIATLTGATMITEVLGHKLENVVVGDLGRAKTITVGKDHTTLIGGAGKKAALQARLSQIRAQHEESTSTYDRQQLQERLAKLTGGVAVITVGAATETEMKEKKSRVEDALSATRAAAEEGVVPGGGVALLRTLPALAKLQLPGAQHFGVEVVRRALEQPLRQMAYNAGVEGAVVVAKVLSRKGSFGYNVATGEYEDLVAAGVLDPTKVVRVALQNAASVASLMLTTEALIAERPTDARTSAGR